MKLTAFRLKDRVHLIDMIDVGLIDAATLDRLPEPLWPRLQELLDSPGGLTARCRFRGFGIDFSLSGESRKTAEG